MSFSVTDYLHFLTYNMDMPFRILYTLEIGYGVLILAMLLNMSGILPYKLLYSPLKKLSAHTIISLGLTLQWLLLQYINSGYIYVITMLVIMLAGIIKKAGEEFENKFEKSREGWDSIGADTSVFYTSYARMTALRFILKEHLFFLGMTLFAEFINDNANGFSAFAIKVFKQYDIGLSIIALLAMFVPVIIIQFAGRTLEHKLNLPEGAAQ